MQKLDFRQLRGEQLRRANDEWTRSRSGPRAEFEARRERDAEFRAMLDGSLRDLRPVFQRALSD